jgi:hypothetical protein
MAWYKRNSDINSNTHGAFDKEHKPGQTPEYSGIYRCKGCGREVVGEEARTLPPQNHHQHQTNQGQVIWRLAVAANHDPH